MLVDGDLLLLPFSAPALCLGSVKVVLLTFRVAGRGTARAVARANQLLKRRHLASPYIRGSGQVSEGNPSCLSVNSLAVRNSAIIAEGAKAFGAQCVVLGMDPVKSGKCPSGYEITTCGFRELTGMDAVEWAKRAVDLGAGEIVVNSVDADGTRGGFELEITKLIADAVSVPVVASGGAGTPEHFVTVFNDAHADAAIVAGMIHTGDYAIADIKSAMRSAGIPTRMSW